MIKYNPVMMVFIITFALAFFVTYFVTPVVKNFASKMKVLDIPNDRKVHSEPVPRLGGAAIYFGFTLAVLAALLLSHFLGVKVDHKMIFGILLGSSLLVAVGVVDDIRGMRPMTKLAWQVLAALIIIAFGVEINFVSNPLSGSFRIGLLAVPLTLLWLVGMANAMNMIDGLDGLATGVTAISAMTLFFVALRTHQIGAAILMLALGAAALGFLRYNFAPASIFLGDSGSMFLGFILAASSIMGVLKTTLVVALVIPVLILGVPIFDTLFAIGRRLRSGKSPFEADNKHIHHLLLRAGFNTREAVLSIYLAGFVLSFIALIMALQR